MRTYNLTPDHGRPTMIYDEELHRQEQANARARWVRRRVWDYTILLIALLLTIGFAAGYWAAQERYSVDPPNCPTEDSCQPNYHGDTDSWTIDEVTP